MQLNMMWHEEDILNVIYHVMILGFAYGSEVLEMVKYNDEYTDLWKAFFESVAIKERENYRCQRNLFPLWSRRHAVEFW